MIMNALWVGMLGFFLLLAILPEKKCKTPFTNNFLSVKGVLLEGAVFFIA